MAKKVSWDRKTLEMISRVCPEILCAPTDQHCGSGTWSTIVRKYDPKGLFRSTHQALWWTCTRPKGHTGKHVACYFGSGDLCPIDAWTRGRKKAKK